jgi:hypothetical protein
MSDESRGMRTQTEMMCFSRLQLSTEKGVTERQKGHGTLVAGKGGEGRGRGGREGKTKNKIPF